MDFFKSQGPAGETNKGFELNIQGDIDLNRLPELSQTIQKIPSQLQYSEIVQVAAEIASLVKRCLNAYENYTGVAPSILLNPLIRRSQLFADSISGDNQDIQEATRHLTEVKNIFSQIQKGVKNLGSPDLEIKHEMINFLTAISDLYSQIDSFLSTPHYTYNTFNPQR